MPECIHFPDDPNAVCGICNKSKVDSWATASTASDTPRGTLEAEYHGTCRSCKATIYPGDLIRKSGPFWIHNDCESTSG